MLNENEDLYAGELPLNEATIEAGSESSDLAVIKAIDLNEESKMLIEQLIAETDEQKTKNLTDLFNANQNKKTMVRVNKLSDLLDTITDQALARFSARPDEISNKELFDGLKVVQDLIERGQKQVSGVGGTPLIQFNQQNNEVNLDSKQSSLSRDSRERVKNTVLNLLNSIVTAQDSPETKDIIEITNGDQVDG